MEQLENGVEAMPMYEARVCAFSLLSSVSAIDSNVIVSVQLEEVAQAHSICISNLPKGQ